MLWSYKHYIRDYFDDKTDGILFWCAQPMDRAEGSRSCFVKLWD